MGYDLNLYVLTETPFDQAFLKPPSTTKPLMTIQQYLGKYPYHKNITLIGPRYEGPVRSESFVEPVLFVDGGTHFRQGKEGYSLGDGDSYQGLLDTTLAQQKDFSDLAFALHSLSPNFTSLALLGFLGGRRDHELFNFGEVHHFVRQRSPGTKVRFDQEVMVFSAGEWTFPLHGLFSLATLETTSFSMFGECEYPVLQATELKPLGSLGLSNFGQGLVTIRCSGPMLLFTKLEE